MKNIFLAEDDADDRIFFEDALREVTIATKLTLSRNGLELMSNLESVIEPPPPDVIFLDLNMPLKNGFQCLEEIRNTDKLKGIPIVILSTTANNDTVNKTYENGANHYICKPQSFGLLVKAIETVLTLEMWQKPQPPKEKFILAFP
jgi:DNA-binding response OmpR family regulator